MGAVTQMLWRMAEGDVNARREVLALFHDPMRRVAHALLKREGRDCSLHTTELVHETLTTKLTGPIPHVTGEQHFLSLTARTMWQTIIERARRRATRWRYANSFRPEPTSRALAPELVICLRREMGLLRKLDPRLARIVYYRVVECRTWEQTAALTGVSYSKAREDYAFAIGWLRDRLRV